MKKGCSVVQQRKDFVSTLTHCTPPLLKEAYPLHHDKEKQQLIEMLKTAMLPTRALDLTRIRNYFGEDSVHNCE